MTDDAFPASTEIDSAELMAEGPSFLVALFEALHLSSRAPIESREVKQANQALVTSINRLLPTTGVLAAQVFGDRLYLNSQRVNLSDERLIEAAARAHFLFGRVGIRELCFHGAIEAMESLELLRRFQSCFRSQEPGEITRWKLSSISVRAEGDFGPPSASAARRQELARCYGQLIIALQDSRRFVAQDKGIALPEIRRAVQALSAAASGQEQLLAGLSRFDTAEGDDAVFSAAVAALVLLLARRLGLDRRRTVLAALAAALHDLGRRQDGGAEGVSSGFEIAHHALVQLCRYAQSPIAMELAAIVFEQIKPAEGDQDGQMPSPLARLVGVAVAYQRLISPPPPLRALRADEAIQVLLDASRDRLDFRVVSLLISVIGRYPIGSVVRTNGDDIAVVVSVPSDPGLHSRPKIRVLPDGAVRSLEEESQLSIVECLDAHQEQVNVARLLLA